MLRDTVIGMPSELRHSAAFELDSPQTKPKGIIQITVHIPSSYNPQSRAEKSTSRWRSAEFIGYYVVFVLALPFMAWIPYQLSSPSHPNYPYYMSSLSSGWLFGRPVDNSDRQYRSFRNGLLPLTLLAGAYLALKHIYLHVRRTVYVSADPSSSSLIPYLVTFSMAMLFGLHGWSALKVIIILSGNYAIARTCGGSKAGPSLTWVYNVLVLFANEKYSGYNFAGLHPSLAALDVWQGLYPRWFISFNITMLRLVSFNMDYYWACNGVGPQDTGKVLSDKHRPRVNHTLDLYSYANYFAYAVYPPLYIAGPIMAFNDFMWQLRRPLRISWRSTLAYLFRFVVCIMTLEIILHTMYVVAIKDRKAWAGYSAAELCMVGVWNLIVVWLKLLVPWRFFRLWALVDGIDPPENMVRCVANNYSTLGFWRSWHRSYNLWLVRYIYIPLGGGRNLISTTVLVFTFVALWHDLSFRLLTWGWLISLFILPELAAHYILPASKFGEQPWYRHVAAAGAVVNFLMMMTANLIGFVIGTDGLKYMVEQIVGTWQGIGFLVVSCACVFVAVQVMFEYREEEARQGIFRRC